MGVRRNHLPFSLLSACLGIGVACRDVSLCATHAQCEAAGEAGATLGGVAGAGGAAASGGRDHAGRAGDEGRGGDGGGGAPDVKAGRGGSAGDGGKGGDDRPVTEWAGAGGHGGQEPPACELGRADCDGSKLTECETPTAFSFRHCGGCDQRCDGACVGGICKPSEDLLRGRVTGFLTSGSAAFLLVDAADDAEPIYHVELDTGALELLVEGFQTDSDRFSRPVMALASDRIYTLASSGEVMSVELDGSGLQTEPFVPETLGATLHGVYYTRTEWSGAADVCSLWYRGSGDSTFRSLFESEYCSILSSSRSALVIERDTEAGLEVALVKGPELAPLGFAPTEPLDVLAVGDDAVFLLHSEDTPSGYELLWLSAEQEPSLIPIDAPPLEAPSLTLAPGGVALTLVDGTHTFVQTYTREGADPLRIGILNSSLLLHVDGYVWYLWYPVEDYQPRLRRARQLELTDLRPEE